MKSLEHELDELQKRLHALHDRSVTSKKNITKEIEIAYVEMKIKYINFKISILKNGDTKK